MVKRAFLYLLRKPARNLLLLLVLIVIGSFITIGITILTSADSSTSNLRVSTGGSIMVELDYTNINYDQSDSIAAGVYSGDYIQDELINEILSIEGITGYTTIVSVHAALANYEYISKLDFEFEYSDHVISVGVTDSESYKYFQSGTYELIEGQHITPDDGYTLLINRDLADHNGLTVGDRVTLYADWNNGKSVKAEIIGIYINNIPENIALTSTSTSNRFITSNTVANGINTGSEINGVEYAIFTVNDPENLETLSSQIKELTNDYFKVSIDSSNYDAIEGSLKALQGLMQVLIVVITAVSIVILTLVLTIWVKNRLYEVGVYISVGISTTVIIFQFILETVVVGTVAFILSFLISSFAAQGIGDVMLQQTAQNAESVAIDLLVEEGRTDIAGVGVETPGSEIFDLNITISSKNYIFTILGGMVIISISVILSSISILRLKPKEIMSKMS